MEIVLGIVIAIGFGITIWVLVQWLKSMQATVSGSTTAMNRRLDEAARVIGALNKQVGEMSEMGRGIRSLQEFLQSPKLRGNIGEQVLKDMMVIGKGISRFHAIYWPAILQSAGLKLPKKLFIHGYMTVNGAKMSKTVGNVVDPVSVIKQFGTDPVRYYLLKEIPAYSDGDYSERRFKEVYNADLANGLGNLVARVARLAGKVTLDEPEVITFAQVAPADYREALDEFRFNDAITIIWEKIKSADKLIDEKTPWKLEGTALTGFIAGIVPQIQDIAMLLQPFLPETSDKILTQFSQIHIESQAPLFPRIK